MRFIRTHLKATAVVVTLLLVGGASIAFAATGDDGPVPVAEPTVSDSGPYRPNNPAPSQAQGVSEAVEQSFAIFRRGATARDHVNDDPFSRPVGANPALARLALVRPDGVPLHLVPAQGAICIRSTDYLEAGCVENTAALSGDNVKSIICAPDLPSNLIELYGVLPDGASEPRMVHADGSASSVDVRNNVYIYRSERRPPLPVSLEFTLDGKQRSVSARVPSDAADERCG